MVLVVLVFGGLSQVVLVWFSWCLVLLYGLVAFRFVVSTPVVGLLACRGGYCWMFLLD